MERRRFTTELKREVVRQAQHAEVSRAKVAQELDLNANMPGRLVRQFSFGKWEATLCKPLKSEQQLEIGRMRRALGKAQTERDILKKAVAL